MSIHTYKSPRCPYDVRYLGPMQDQGPLPAVFYFILSASASLTQDPFHQPTLPFLQEQVRIFSVTIPGHEPPKNPEDAMAFWRDSFLRGKDILTPFFDEVAILIQELIDQNSILPNKIAFMGLSRGGFTALQIAARLPAITTLALFAPMTNLNKIQELSSLPKTILDRFALDQHLATLCRKKIWISIGNNDTRVDTGSTIAFFQKLCAAALNEGLRVPAIELKVTQSVGYKGHGSSPEIFSEGSQWVKNLLLHK